MNAKEHAAKLAAARAELARIESIVPDKERPGMILPYSNAGVRGWWNFSTTGVRLGMNSGEQIAAYEYAFATMLLMRAQKGIVNPAESSHWYLSVSHVVDVYCCGPCGSCLNSCMFPCFATESDARAAIAAVGEDRIIRCAKWLAGCV